MFLSLCVGLSSKENPDVMAADASLSLFVFLLFCFSPSASSNLLFPALALLAVGGIGFLITNMQVQKHTFNLELMYFVQYLF